MHCDQCGSTDQVVNTEDGRLCRSCYRGFKSREVYG